MWVLQRGHSGDGCVLASTLCKYDLRKGHHHHVVLSNYLLPSLYACLSCIVELYKVVQGAGVCQECALQHVRRVLCCQAAFTCCVSVEISPLPLFFATSVSSS